MKSHKPVSHSLKVDANHLTRLKQGDSEAERYFVKYFSELIHIKLTNRGFPPAVIHDVSQETFLRVFTSIREGAIMRADQLGAYVNSVCNSVLFECYRFDSRDQYSELKPVGLPDLAVDLEGIAIARERKRERKMRMRRVLNQLPERDRSILYALLQEKCDKDKICKEFGVDRGYLPILLSRTKAHFRERS
jgi:RNA polymerase sigma-70 factor (ECF subfamily)